MNARVATRLAPLPAWEARFRVGDRFLRIFSDRADIRDHLQRAYGRLRAEHSELPVSVDSGSIGWDGASAMLTFGGERLPRIEGTATPLDAAVRGAATLFGMTFRRMRTHRALYAAGAVAGSRAFALVAPSGSGKTTLLLELLRRGWTTLGDEFILLDRETLVAQPFPLGLAVRETSLPLCADPRVGAACAAAPATGSPGSRTFHHIDIASTFGPWAIAGPLPLTHVVLLERTPGAEPKLERMPGSVAALRALPNFFIDDVAMTDIWETVDAVSRLSCYRLAAPDCHAAADLLETLARG